MKKKNILKEKLPKMLLCAASTLKQKKATKDDNDDDDDDGDEMARVKNMQICVRLCERYMFTSVKDLEHIVKIYGRGVCVYIPYFATSIFFS